jgi:hypothetical protein
VNEKLINASRARDRAAELAKLDSPGALREARAITEPWYRAQALAFVIRFAPQKEIDEISAEAFEACRSCADAYQHLAAAAWPLAALIERGAFEPVREVLAALLAREGEVQPASSRSEALFTLFQACFDLDAVTREDFVQRLVAAHVDAQHWRSRRNLIDALAMLNGRDAEAAKRIAATVDDQRVRRRMEEIFRAKERMRPRPFFS